MVVTAQGGVLLALSRQGPGLLLNTLQGTVQPPLTKNYSEQSVRSARVEISCFKQRKEGFGSVSGNQRSGEKKRRIFVFFVCLGLLF